MKSPRVLHTLLIILPLLAAGAATGTIEHKSATDSAPQVVIRGTISAWRLVADGSVLFRVQPLDAEFDKTRPLWFRMPSTKNATTHAEIQVLMVVLMNGLGGQQHGVPITVTGQAPSQEHGRDEERPIELSSIAMP